MITFCAICFSRQKYIYIHIVYDFTTFGRWCPDLTFELISFMCLTKFIFAILSEFSRRMLTKRQTIEYRVPNNAKKRVLEKKTLIKYCNKTLQYPICWNRKSEFRVFYSSATQYLQLNQCTQKKCPSQYKHKYKYPPNTNLDRLIWIRVRIIFHLTIYDK